MASSATIPTSLTQLPPDYPALEPPPGVAPNFNAPPDAISTALTAIVAVGLVLTTFCVFARLYTRHFVVKALGWDDWTSLLSWVLWLGYAVISLESAKYGSGVHQWDVPISKFIPWLKVGYLGLMWFTPLITVIKLSILLQYMRVFTPIHSGKTYYAILLAIFANISYTIALVFALIFVCNPRRKAWDPLVPGKCLDVNLVLLVGGVITFVLDFVALVLPMPKLWMLQMGLRRKLGLSLIFAFGLLACICSVMRVVFSLKLKDNQDVTYARVSVGLFTLSEAILGIVCGCLPVMPRFFVHCTASIKSFSSHSASKGHSSVGGGAGGGDGSGKPSVAGTSSSKRDSRKMKTASVVANEAGGEGNYIELKGQRFETGHWV